MKIMHPPIIAGSGIIEPTIIIVKNIIRIPTKNTFFSFIGSPQNINNNANILIRKFVFRKFTLLSHHGFSALVLANKKTRHNI